MKMCLHNSEKVTRTLAGWPGWLARGPAAEQGFRPTAHWLFLGICTFAHFHVAPPRSAGKVAFPLTFYRKGRILPYVCLLKRLDLSCCKAHWTF